MLCEKAKQKLAEVTAIRKEELRVRCERGAEAQAFDDCFSLSFCPECGETLVRIKQLLGFFRDPKKHCPNCKKTWVHRYQRYKLPAYLSGKSDWTYFSTGEQK